MDLFGHPYITFGIVVILGILVTKRLSDNRKNPLGLPVPPGPKGYPLIGSLLENPTDNPWLVYEAWSKKYGDILHFKVLGTSFIILGSLKRTTDLFEKRSSNYSDRIRMPMITELMRLDWNMTFFGYGQWWRRHLRLFHEFFRPDVTNQYQPVQHRETTKFLVRLLETPDKFLHHIRHMFSATIMNVTYGIQVHDTNDPYIFTAEEIMAGLAEAGIMGKFLVDLIPALKYMPSWMPGAEFKRKAARWRKISSDVETKPFYYVKEKMKSGEAVMPCLTATMIEKLPEETDPTYCEEETIARHVAAVAYVGGAEPTISTLQFFFLAMAMYPEVQKRAQAELDAVVGPGRLPSFSDRNSLTYINAMVKESMRWQLAAPLSVPHMCTVDDIYDGYFIPKGSIVIGNAWSILHDPEEFSEPEEFQPERYLKDGELNSDLRSPDVAAFGYGRRICPGRFMSDNSLFIMIALVLSVYNVEPPVDKEGNIIKLTAKVTSGILLHPAPFNCRIIPRSKAAEALIRQVDEE